MILKIFVDSDDQELVNRYSQAAIVHNAKRESDYHDAGFDLFVPSTHYVQPNTTVMIDHKIKCSAKIYSFTSATSNACYYLYPRSSIVKTPLRMANSTGIIDSGYRGNIKAVFDVMHTSYTVNKFDRCVQICAPSLIPILVQIVSSIDDLGDPTERNEGGFGSTGR
jgi:dUTP pyrophosphatase